MIVAVYWLECYCSVQRIAGLSLGGVSAHSGSYHYEESIFSVTIEDPWGIKFQWNIIENSIQLLKFQWKFIDIFLLTFKWSITFTPRHQLYITESSTQISNSVGIVEMTWVMVLLLAIPTSWIQVSLLGIGRMTWVMCFFLAIPILLIQILLNVFGGLRSWSGS